LTPEALFLYQEKTGGIIVEKCVFQYNCDWKNRGKSAIFGLQKTAKKPLFSVL
jgi:hypothetical protein